MMRNERHLGALTLEQIKEIKETFYILSKGNEALDIGHLKTAMMGLGLYPSNDEIERIINQQKIFRRNKTNGTGTVDDVSLKEFMEIVSYRLTNRRIEEDCKRTFQLLSEGKNEITTDNISGLVQHFEEKLTDDDIYNIVSHGDINKDGKINYDDFQQIMKHSNYY